MVELTPKQRRIVKAKLLGKKNKDIAKLEYPKAKDHSAEVLISRELKKPHVAKYKANQLQELLKSSGVTESQYFMNIGQAMQADKQNNFTGEIIPDWTTRLAANKQAERFLKLTENPPKDNLIENFKGMDEVELQRAIFRKSDSTENSPNTLD